MTQSIEVGASLEVKAKVEADHQAACAIVNIVGSPTIKEIVQLLARSGKSAERTTILNLYVRVLIDVMLVPIDRDLKKGKGKRFHEVNEQRDKVMDDLVDQVQSLFYNDVNFESVNKRMHTSIHCETPNGKFSCQTFKIDTWADGNFDACNYV